MKKLNDLIMDLFDYIIDNYGAIIMLVILLGFFVVLPIVVINSGDTITLDTKEWNCTNTYMTRRFNGKVWYEKKECSSWVRKDIE